MAAEGRWSLFLLLTLLIGIFHTFGEEYSICLLTHNGLDPQQKLVFVSLDTYVDLNVFRLFDSSMTSIKLLQNDRHVFDLTSSNTKLRKNSIENKGIKVTSSGKIHILGYDKVRRSTDIFIPREHGQLGKQYTALTHCQGGNNCLMGIVAVEDDVETRVSVILPHSITNYLYFRGKQYTGGDVMCFRLNPLQTFQLASQSDLTGTVVLSNANLSVVMGATKTIVEIPDSSADHLIEAAPPVEFWGTRYFLVKTESIYTDYVKIVAAVNNTAVTISACNKTTTLVIEKAFQDHVAYTLDCSFNYISTDRQMLILVGHFVRMRNGNPSLYFPIPRKHFASSYIISSPPQNTYLNCTLVLVATYKAKIVYNSVISVDGWNPILSTGFKFTSFLVPTSGIRNTIIDTDGRPFGGYILCYSHNTTAATALVPLSYDANQIASMSFLRPEDISAIELCSASRGYFSTEVTSTLVTDTMEPLLPDEIAENSTLPVTADGAATDMPVQSNNDSISFPSTTCSCSRCLKSKNASVKVVDLDKFLQTIKSEMLIKKKDVSSWKRKLISADDRRRSSKGIGLLGCLLLCCVVGSIVLVDIFNYCLVFKSRKIDCHA